MTRSILVRSSQISSRSGHVKMCQVMSVRGDVTSGHDRSSQIWSGQVRSCQSQFSSVKDRSKSGQVKIKSSHVRLGQDKSSQVRSVQIMSGSGQVK